MDREPKYPHCKEYYTIYWKDRTHASIHRAYEETAAIVLFENEDKLTFSQLKRRYFKPKGKKSTEWWASTRSGDSYTLSFRYGRVDLYHYTPPKDRRKKSDRGKVRNYTCSADTILSGINPSKYCQDSNRTIINYTPEELLLLFRDLTTKILKEQNRICRVPTDNVKRLSDVVVAAAYPVIGDFMCSGVPISGWSSPPKGLSRPFREENLRDCCRLIFGRKATPKVIRLTGESIGYGDYVSFDNLLLAYIAKNLISGDHLQEILGWRRPESQRKEDEHGFRKYTNLHSTGFNELSQQKEIKEFLRHFPVRKIVDFLGTVYNQSNGSHLLTDTIRMILHNGDRLVMPDRIRGLQNLHDELAAQEKKLKNPDFEIDTKELSELEGSRIGNLTVHFPTSRYELIQWSTDLNNCISSYAREMKRGDCVLLSLSREGKPIYHVMLDTGLKHVEQFYGDRNSPPFPPDVEAFENWLVDQNVWTPVRKYATEARKIKVPAFSYREA